MSSLNPKYCVSERFDYLQKLIHEFNVSNSKEVKRQVLANISSFAYNPNNWEALNKLNAIPLLLDSLKYNDHKIREFAIKGLCNLCTDPLNNRLIFNNEVLVKVNNFLKTNITNENIIITVLTLFIFSQEFNQQISESVRTEIKETVNQSFKTNQNKRIENLLRIYHQNCESNNLKSKLFF